MSKLEHVTLWKEHITANSQDVQNCLSARLGVRPEHLWSRSLSVPTQHIISVISHFSASSQWGFSQSFCIQSTKAQRRWMRKQLSFFAECFLFHLFLWFEKAKKESVLNVMYRDSGSEAAAVPLFSSKHLQAQWPFIPWPVTWQGLRLPCHPQLLQAQRDQDLQPHVMDSIHNHRVPWAPWALRPGNVTFGMHLPSPACHLHYTACTKI